MNDAPKGWRTVDCAVHVSPSGKVVIEGRPDEVWPDLVDVEDNHPHNCDAMGCGRSHVIVRARLPNAVDEVLVTMSEEYFMERLRELQGWIRQQVDAQVSALMEDDLLSAAGHMRELGSLYRRLADFNEASAARLERRNRDAA